MRPALRCGPQLRIASQTPPFTPNRRPFATMGWLAGMPLVTVRLNLGLHSARHACSALRSLGRTMNSPQGPIWKFLAVVGACILLALVPLVLNQLARKNAVLPSPAPSMRDVSTRGAVRSRIAPSEEAAALARPTPRVPAGPHDAYEDVTERAGIKFVHQFCDERIANILESNGQGVAVLDYDRDGFVDLYFVNAGPLDGVTHHKPGTKRESNRLYRNRGDGTFEDVTEKAGMAGHGYGSAVAAADYDGDGWVDLFVVNIGQSILYRNKGDGTFEDVTEKAGLSRSGTGIGAVFLDADLDGKLDLFVVNYLTFDRTLSNAANPDVYPGPLSYQPEFNVLYRNKGDGTFEDVSEKAGIRIAGHRAMSACAFDFDLDGDPDLYICNDGTPNLLLINDGKGHFEDVAMKLGVAFNGVGEAAGSMAASVGDCNNDLAPDLFVSRLGYGSLYMGSPRKGPFEDLMAESGLGEITKPFVGWGCNFLDMDNDGDLDAFIANGEAQRVVAMESLLLENDGSGKFSNAADKGGNYFMTKVRGRGSAVLDLDNDGREDIVVTLLGDRPVLLHNRSTNGNNWISLDLTGTKSNREGFGALIRVTAGGKTYLAEARCPSGFLSQSDRRVHFGLAQAKIVDQIEIRWPSRAVQVLTNLPANQVLKITEP